MIRRADPFAALAACALACAGCRARPPPAPDPAQGRIAFVVQSLSVPGLVRVDWDLKFWFLDPAPPVRYGEFAASSVQQGGRMTAILGCLTSPSGTGVNQVQATAQLWFAGQAQPVQGNGTALFTCVRSMDAPVSLVISIRNPADVGFVDATAAAYGISCASKIDYKGDDWLAVCGSSSCGDPQAAFVFANACRGSDGAAPSYWACGSPADWTIVNVLAESQFPVPPGDGSWSFGVSAAQQIALLPADLSLTDAAGNLLVYKQVPTPLATLVRAGGVNRSAIDAARVADFAADLVLPALAIGGATPHQLLELRNLAGGATASAWTRFGACDPPAVGNASWAGLFVIDVRLRDPGSVKLILSTAANGLATRSATCSAQRAADGTPQVSCTAAGPLT
jgi:hypothetical protein